MRTLFVLSVCSALLIHQTTSGRSVLTSNAFYTEDYINSVLPAFAAEILEFTMGSSIRPATPFWDLSVDLNNTHGAAISGFAAFELQKYNPSATGHGIVNTQNLCDFDPFVNDVHLNFADVHFESFSFAEMVNAQPQTLHLSAKQPIDTSGVWVNIIHLCVRKGQRYASQLQIASHQTAVNPLGRLGGQYLFAFPFLVAMGCVYGVLALLWMFWMIQHRRSLLPHIHWLIFIGLCVAFLENASHLLSLLHFNHAGAPSTSLLIADALFTIALSLYARVVMVLVSTGHGIVFPELKRSVIAFLCFYSVLYTTVYGTLKRFELDFMLHGPSAMAANLRAFEAWLMGLAFLDCMLNWFMLENLNGIMQHLTDARQQFKLRLYRQLIIVLALTFVASAAGLLMHAHFVKRRLFADPSNWRLQWMLQDGLWRFLFLMLAVSVISLWRPHRHSRRYAFSMELARKAESKTGNSEWQDDNEWKHDGGAMETQQAAATVPRPITM